MQWVTDLDEHAACGLCYTSGTTGHPKGVAYSHRSQFIMTLAMQGIRLGVGEHHRLVSASPLLSAPTRAQAKDVHCLGGADVLLPVVPYFHANGWGLPHLALTLGTRIVHNGRC